MRIGMGFDVHRLIPVLDTASIPLGGISIPTDVRVEAHSDGDVLLHAIVDACLGALALGDIGQWFPENREENRHRSSHEFVAEVKREIQKLGWKISQIDSIIYLEEPKIRDHVDSIRMNLARIFDLELSSISVKTKTMEGLGAIGAQQAIAAHAIVVAKQN